MRYSSVVFQVLIVIIFSQDDIAKHYCNNTFPQLAEGWNYNTQDIWIGREQDHCSSKSIQSPIDIITSNIFLSDNELQFEYRSRFAGNWTAKVDPGWNALLYYIVSISLGNYSNCRNMQGTQKHYLGNDIRFRFPSEHTLNGYQFDGEIQISYVIDPNQCIYLRDQEAKLAIVSIFLLKDNVEDDLFFDNLISGTELKNFDIRSNITNFLQSKSTSYITYTGSLPYPQIGSILQLYNRPCNLTDWIILTKPKRINEKQLAEISWKYIGNTRQVQVNTKQIKYEKGIFMYTEDDNGSGELNNDGVWAAIWAASIGPCFFLLLIILIFGMYKLTQQHHVPPKNLQQNEQDEVKGLTPNEQEVQQLKQEKQEPYTNNVQIIN